MHAFPSFTLGIFRRMRFRRRRRARRRAGGELGIGHGLFYNTCTFAEAKSMPIVTARPRDEWGRAILELRNGFEQSVRVKGIFADLGESGPRKPLLDAEMDLPAGGPPQTIDVTEKLLQLLVPTAQEKLEVRERNIQISLHLEPDPPHQPPPAIYRVVFEGKRILEFTSK